jgi:hypothetical protein
LNAVLGVGVPGDLRIGGPVAVRELAGVHGVVPRSVEGASQPRPLRVDEELHAAPNGIVLLRPAASAPNSPRGAASAGR